MIGSVDFGFSLTDVLTCSLSENRLLLYLVFGYQSFVIVFEQFHCLRYVPLLHDQKHARLFAYAIKDLG